MLGAAAGNSFLAQRIDTNPIRAVSIVCMQNIMRSKHAGRPGMNRIWCGLLLGLTGWVGPIFPLPSADAAETGGTPDFPPALRRFVVAKEKQAKREAERVQLELSPEVLDYFKAAADGDWSQALGMYQDARRSVRESDDDPDQSSLAAVARATLLEVQLALEQVMDSNPALALKLGEAMMASVSKGAIYFGGTDGGRGLPTALSTSHERGEPFFTLTQNALADGQYLSYLRGMYGTNIEIPGKEDSEQAFQGYIADAERRMSHDQEHPKEPRQLKPGENVRTVKGRVQVSGQVAVMAINARLAKVIFERNPDREFFVEESFPLDWMYPHLAPAGMVMKLNREPRSQISAAEVDKDMTYWAGLLKPLIGEVAAPGLTVSNVFPLVRKVHVERNLDGFKGDAAFVQAENLRKMYAKLRASIGGLYAWRMNQASDAATKQRMARAAETAFLQAFLVCPSGTEAVYRYADLLVGQGRVGDALQMTELAEEAGSGAASLGALIRDLRRMQSKADEKAGKAGDARP